MVVKKMRSIYCGKVSESLINEEVDVCGWVHRRRNHGGVIFIDLRDREGKVQVVCHPEQKDTFAIGEQLRDEFVINVRGVVQLRPAGTINENMETGKIEI